jgi:hypothetical protein
MKGARQRPIVGRVIHTMVEILAQRDESRLADLLNCGKIAVFSIESTLMTC